MEKKIKEPALVGVGETIIRAAEHVVLLSVFSYAYHVTHLKLINVLFWLVLAASWLIWASKLNTVLLNGLIRYGKRHYGRLKVLALSSFISGMVVGSFVELIFRTVPILVKAH